MQERRASDYDVGRSRGEHAIERSPDRSCLARFEFESKYVCVCESNRNVPDTIAVCSFSGGAQQPCRVTG